MANDREDEFGDVFLRELNRRCLAHQRAEDIVSFIEAAYEKAADDAKCLEAFSESIQGSLVDLTSFDILSRLSRPVKREVFWIVKTRQFNYQRYAKTFVRIVADRHHSDETRGMFWWLSRNIHPFIPAALANDCITRELCSQTDKEENCGLPYDYENLLNGRSDIPDRLRETIRADSVPLFEITRTMCNKQVGIGIFRACVTHKAGTIAAHLMRNYWKTYVKWIEPKSFLFYVCRCRPFSLEASDESGDIAVLKSLEEIHPGLIAGAVDGFGYDALWYLLFGYRHRPDGDALADFLISCGCDPGRRNHLNLSYNIIRANYPNNGLRQ